MATLAGNKQKLTYQLLLKLTQAIDGTLRYLQGGDGTNLPIQISTGGVNFTGTAQRAGKDLVDADELTAALAVGLSGLDFVDSDQLAAAIAAGLSGVVRPVVADVTAFTGATTIVLEPLSSFQTIIPVTVAVGVGTYTAALALSVTGATKGNIVLVKLAMPTSASRVLEIRNASGAGTVLATFTSSADWAGIGSFAAYFDGAAWQPLNLATFGPAA